MKKKIDWELVRNDIKKLKGSKILTFISDWFLNKNVIKTFIACVILIVLIPFFWNNILPFLLLPENPSSWQFDLLVIVFSVYLTVVFLIKAIKNYRPSFNQYLYWTISIVTYWFTKFLNDNVEFYSFTVLKDIKYLDLIFSTPLIFISTKIILFKIIKKEWLEKYLITDDKNGNKYFEDEPLESSKKNEKIVSEIYELIKENNYKGSFSIGVIAPWGTGKTTTLNGVKNKLKDENVKTININFSPFLNHKEDEIVNEFFTSFISQLSPYSGRLTKSVNEYASSISKFYKRGELDDLIKGQNLFHNKSAAELYEEIKGQVIEVKQKIVVFVDDLDRLNSKEIIQVLKLIRNSSSFPNTFFIVALDKSYVINSLINDKNYIDGSFLDKFFQLEVNLPEITNLELKNHFNKLLIYNDSFALKEILEEINSSSPLLFEYIRNYRDCIKLCNLLVLHCSILSNLIKEIDKDELIHVLLLKSKFPEIYYDLVKNRLKYLKRKDQRYYLRKIKEIESSNIINLFELEGYKGVEDFSEYSIESFIHSNRTEYNYTKSEILLIKKTLHYLFASEQKPENSVAVIRNFDRLSYLSYSSDDLPYDEIEDAINQNNIEFIKRIVNGNMVDQFYNVIRHFIYSNELQLRNTINYLSDLYHIDYQKQLDFERNLSIIEQIFNSKLNYNSGPINLSLEFKNNWLNDIIDKQSIHYDIKLKLLLNIHYTTNSKNTYGLNHEKLKGLMNKVFLDKLEQLKKIDWEITDFSIYHIFHRIKDIVDKEGLKTQFKNFIESDNIITFCGQVLDVNFNRYNQFKLKEFVIELFGNFNAFKTFIEEHNSAGSPEITEFIEFLKLQEYFYYNRYLKFQFQKLPLIDHKSQDHNSEYDNDLADKTYQILVEFSISKDEMIRNTDFGFDHSKSRFEKDDKKYIYFSNHHVDLKTMLSNIYNGYLLAYSDIINIDKCQLNIESKEFVILKKDGNELIKTKFVI